MSHALVFERYGNDRTNSGVSRYAIVDEVIHVQFHDDRVYVYGAQKPGAEHVAKLKELARLGSGLSAYISRQVHDDYESSYRLSTTPTS